MELGGGALYVTVFAIAVLLDAGLILAWRHFRRPSERPQEPPVPVSEDSSPAATPPAPPDLRDLPAWAAAHWREMVVVVVLLAVLGYVWVLTPRHVIPALAAWPVERPPLAGLARVWRFFIERLFTWIFWWPIVSMIVAAGLCLLGWRTRRWSQALRAAVLFGLLALALEGEMFLLGDDLVGVGRVLHVLALLGFAAWVGICRPAPVTQEQPVEGRRMDWVEWALLLCVVALAAFARFYALSRIPYGIEGDESKWTVEVVSVMVDGQHAIQSEFHYGTEPVSFYMQAPFHLLLGPSILSARVAVATYSLLATLAFYWLVRETAGWRVALLATVLLSVSIADVSASRLALVEGHVKIWAVIGLAFLARGLRVRRPVHSFLGGVALAFGLLTYDTFAPMVAVALIWAVVALASRRASLREWAVHLSALLLPILAATPFVLEYLVGRMSYYRRGQLGWGITSLDVWNGFLGVVQNFWLAPRDFLLVRSGPLINALLVPLLALGLVLALSRPRRPGYVLPALWFVLLFFPVPIYTGHPFLRVFYPGLPAVYVLVAFGVLLVWREMRALLPASLRSPLLSLAGLALAGLVLLNLFLYFNVVQDPEERQMRRELADMVTEGVAPGRRVYVPHFADSGDAAQVEQPLFLLEARRRLPRDQIEQHLWMGTYREFLPTLSRERAYFEDAAVVVNRWPALGGDLEDVNSVLDALERCLGARLERQGRWFSLYAIDAFDLDAARCVAPLARLEGPFPLDPTPDQSIQLRWRLEDATGPAEAVLACQRLHTGVVVLEAEDMASDFAWYEDRRFAPGFQGRSYLADRTTVGDAHADITIPESGAYTLWARIYRSSPDSYPLYLSVDGRTEDLVYTGGGSLDQWTWRQVGHFDLVAGTHTVLMARPIRYPIPGTRSLFVDRLLFSADPAFDPAVDDEWVFSFDARDEVSAYASSGVFQLDGLSSGSYRCWAEFSDGSRLVDWNGQAGVCSNPLDFAVYSEEDK
ncbi:MAG: glycosyltransferase family 39 protein [Anaerolineae bacterium]|nr:glycosyltransferase family 39 protein [Anaerolineae bacterium]